MMLVLVLVLVVVLMPDTGRVSLRATASPDPHRRYMLYPRP